MNSTDGSMPLNLVKELFSQTDNPHFANTSLISFENTNNSSGGTVVPQQNIVEVCEFARENSIGTHLDGARLFNAAIASKQSVAELAAPFDTTSICLSKGLGAPVGSLLVGSNALIGRAYRYRKMYGGGMRQAGFLAAAALYALEHNVAGLHNDHRRALEFAGAIAKIGRVKIDLASVQTNIVYFTVDGCDVPTLIGTLDSTGIKLHNKGHRVRAVFHHQIDDNGLQRAIQALKMALS